MIPHINRIAVIIACVMLTLPHMAAGQTTIPQSIITPDKVETRLGTLEFKDEAPDMVSPAGTEPYAGTIVQVKPSSFWLFCWNFKSFLPPYPLYTLTIHYPSLSSKECCNTSVSAPAVSTGETNYIFS